MPPMKVPARPSPIVAKIPIGSGPGSARRANAPTIRPLRASARMYQRTIAPSLAPQAFEQTCAGACVLGVVEDARIVELLQQAQVVSWIVGRRSDVAGACCCCGTLCLRDLLERAEGLDPDLV